MYTDTHRTGVRTLNCKLAIDTSTIYFCVRLTNQDNDARASLAACSLELPVSCTLARCDRAAHNERYNPRQRLWLFLWVWSPRVARAD